MTKKNFIRTFSESHTAIKNRVEKSKLSDSEIPSNKIVQFPQHLTEKNRSFSFEPFYGAGYDQIVCHCHKEIEQLVNRCITIEDSVPSIITVISYCRRGLINFFPYCRQHYELNGHELTLQSINCTFMLGFVRYLSEHYDSVVTQRICYTSTKGMLLALAKKGVIPKDVFPYNPYPGINQKLKGESPLSRSEFKRLLNVLRMEMSSIDQHDAPLSAFELTVCVLVLAARTGLNPTPLLDLKVDCLQPHPLKSNRMILQCYKKRSNKHLHQTVNTKGDTTISKTVLMDTANIIHLVINRNHQIRQSSEHPDHLFVFVPQKPKIKVCRQLNCNNINHSIRNLRAKHELKDDQGAPLTLNIMRLRKTFINRIWELSGQDPLLTSAIAGHSFKITESHYLSTPSHAQKNFKFIGETRAARLLGLESQERIDNTPVGSCKDTLNGHQAPKNGLHCSNFLACFRCRSFVVTEDDLYRLFSFYWLLKTNHSDKGNTKIEHYHQKIIGIIEDEISPQFSHQAVHHARIHARENPHPSWMSLDVLESYI